MKGFYTAIAATGLLLLSCTLPANARKRVFHLTEYGITPNTGATDNSSRLAKALQEIADNTKNGDEIVLKLTKGRYDFHASDATPRELYVSNHDQDQPKIAGIFIEGWKNLTIDGNGAELVFHGRMIPVVLKNTENCKLRNFSIDFSQPQIGQAEILKNDKDAGITFSLLPGTSWRTDKYGRLELYGEGWANTPIAGIAFEGDTRHIVYQTSDLNVNTTGIKDLGNGQLLAPNWKDRRLKPGTRVALRSWYRPCPGIFMDGNSNTELFDIQVHYAEGMGLIAQRCADITLKKFSVCLKGKDDPRYFTTQADATHFSQCKGRIVSERGLYEGMMDDAINIHGVYLKVRERIDDYSLRCRFEHDQAWGFEWGDPGDSVAFIRSATMETAGRPNTIADIKPIGQEKVAGCREFVIRFKDRLPAEIDETGYGVENLTWTPEVVFRRNVIRNNRARGALFSSPRRTVCENNIFDHTSGTAILLCGDCNGWYESGAVRDLTICKNKFNNALTNMFQFTNAVISIYPEIPDLKDQRQYFHGGHPGAIVIEDNVFETFDAPLLYAKSVFGLVFKDNKVIHNSDYAPFHWNKQPVLLEHCKEAVIPGYVTPQSNTTRLYR